MTPVRIFYEDQAGEREQFSPHLFLCACVADRLGISVWDVRDQRIDDGQPKNGAANLLKACRLHARSHRKELVFALFDADRVHTLLNIPKGSLEQLQAALAAEIQSPKVRPFLLVNNIETLVEASARCLEPPIEGPILKEPNERDRILNRAATASPSVRDCMRRAVPSFAALIDAVAEALA